MSRSEDKLPRVLVVDDDAALRDSLGVVLETLGYAVDYATDGRSALVEVARHRPEAIITDLQMPGMDGFALLQEMAIVNRHVPVIAISGGGPDALLTARRLGAVATFSKPVLDTDLASAIEHCRAAAQD